MLWKKKPVISRQRPTDKNQSSPVYSYYNSPNPSRAGHDKTIDLSSSNRLRLAPSLIALAVIVASLLFSLTLSSKPNLTTTDGNPSPYRAQTDYETEAQRLLNASFGNKTKLTIQTAQIEQQLIERFPELKAASLRLPILGRRLNLVIELRKPVLLLSTPGKSFVLDETGRAVSELQDLNESARQGLVVIRDQSGLAVEVGKQAITTETVSFLQAVSAQLKAQSLTVSELTLPPSANQLDIRIQGNQYYIKTDVSGDARLQIGSYLAVRDKLSREGITPSEYIDVRVEEKVFYK